MHSEQFRKTTIGTDYLQTGQYYPIDSLLDYLSGLTKMRAENEHNELWRVRYTNEINAVKEILKIQTA